MTPLLRYGVTAVLAATVAAKLVALNLADSAVRQRNLPLVAALAPTSPHAAAQAAEATLAARAPTAAENLARRALEGAALSAQALRVYGVSREAQGDLNGAAQVMATAGALGWRDTPTQLWLLDAYARQGDMAAALERADALARRRQHNDQMGLILLGAAVEPGTRAIVAQRLAAGPNWRSHFFEGARLLPPRSFDRYAGFLDHFVRAENELVPSEVEPFVDKLFKEGRYGRARETWRRYAAAGQEDPGNELFDGRFTSASLEGAAAWFQWRFPQVPGTETALRAPSERNADRALYVASSGNIRAEMASQALSLQPGRYVLAFEAAGADGAPLAGFSWQIACLPSGQSLDLGEPIRGGADWSNFERRFSVPSSHCGGQQLRLVLHGDRSEPIAVWLDNLGIRQVRDRN